MDLEHALVVDLGAHPDSASAIVKGSHWNAPHKITATGVVTFADSDTEKTLTFADQGGTAYELVILSVRAASAAAPWLGFRTKYNSKTATQCVLEASGTPGTGESIAVAWGLVKTP